MATTAIAKHKIWQFPEAQTPSEDLVDMVGGSEIVAKLLMRRGIDSIEKASSFLNPANYVPTNPDVFADMPKAVQRIKQAITKEEKITVYGDYDVDGVTATSVMYTVLKDLGANVDFYIPNRATEGYGLNLKAVSVLASKHRTKLIISCDCGISNFSEINLAKSLGVETIIVDHHSMPEVLPPAIAILHPKQFDEEHPLFHLPGVGVAYKLAEALLLDKGQPEQIEKLHDFVTLGMIADMVPLIRENRYLVQIGLPALVNSERAGIKALLDNTVKMEGSDIVGFGLAPRINAVGRLADASLAVKLMTVDNSEEAEQLARQLESENLRRQELCEQIFFEADQKAKAALASGQDRALALYSPDWHHGVVGIVASRLVEKYHCPVFVAELETEEGKLKGSARGIPGIDLYQVLKANEHLMTKWGGHQMAAGYSAEATNADALCRALVDTCNRMLEGHSSRATLDIDLLIESKDLDLHLAKAIRQLGPFGMWNKKPVLAMRSLQVLNTRVLGKDGKHHRIVFRSFTGEGPFECVYWRSGGRIPVEGQEIDLAFNPEINVYNNNERLQLVLCDWRAAGAEELVAEAESLDFTPPQEAGDLVGAAVGTNSTTGKNPVAEVSSAHGTSDPVLSSEHPSSDVSTMAGAVDVTVHVETSYDGTTASTSIKGYTVRPAQLIESETAPDPKRPNPLDLPKIASTVKPGTEQEDFEPSHVVAADHLDEASAAATPGVNKLSPSSSAAGASVHPKKVDLPPMAASAPALGDPLPSLSIHGQAPAPSPSETVARPAQVITFRDLREHGSSPSVVDAAMRKLGDKLQIFAEASKLDGHKLCDRTAVEESAHLLIWQYPPSLQVFRALIAKSKPSQIYFSGAGTADNLDTPAFLKKLLSLVRFAVNQKDGQAHADKLAAALASTKMCLALGLTILKKLNVIDWYSEDSILYMDILGQPSDSWDSLPEYRQLSNSLKEIREFRAWCADAPLEEVQSELVPNAIKVSDKRAEAPGQEASSRDSNLRVNYDERASYTSGQ